MGKTLKSWPSWRHNGIIVGFMVILTIFDYRWVNVVNQVTGAHDAVDGV
jgi:hypothetical protein